MSDFFDEDEEDESEELEHDLDQSDDSSDEEEVDEFRRGVTQPPVSVDRLDKGLAQFPTRDVLFRQMIEKVILLHQTHGDADANLADVLTDIESSLRTHVWFIHNQPGPWVISIIAAMPPEKQTSAARNIISDLETFIDRIGGE